jgi:pyrimidine-nucleoside phosphorylase
MGKKLAAGSKSIVLDVKYGSGSFMKTPESARALAEGMVRIGKMRGRKISAIITDMDKPLGRAIGNSLEIKEAIAALRGEGPEDLTEVSLALATEMVSLSLSLSREEAEERVRMALKSGLALAKLKEWLTAQGSDKAYVENPDLLPEAPLSYTLVAEKDGYVTKMNTELIGLSSVALGGGRVTKEDSIDYSAGIIIEKKTGDKITRGDVIATLYSSDEKKLEDGARMLRSAITVGDVCPKESLLIFDRIN